MILTKDHKKFFTHEKNFSQLIEFSRVFDAEISKVQIPNEIEVLELEQLAPALCEKKSQKVDYKVLEVKFKNTSTSSRSNKIQKYIEKNLLNGKMVSLKSLKSKYKLSSPLLCIYFSKTRNKLKEQGYVIQKIGGGKYKLKS